MNVTNMVNLAGAPSSPIAVLSESSEESDTSATFADFLQDLKNQGSSQNPGTAGTNQAGTVGNNGNPQATDESAEILELETESETGATQTLPKLPVLEISEGNPLFKFFNRIIARLKELGENGELADPSELTWEDWREALGGISILFEYGGNDLGDVKKKFDDFVEDIIAIFTVYIDYSNGKIEELEKFEAISGILSARIQNGAGTEGGKAFDNKIWELIIQFLERLDPTVNWQEQEQWAQWSALATEGGEQQSKITVVEVVEKIQTTVSISYVPNVRGETFTKSKTLKIELPEFVKSETGTEQEPAKSETNPAQSAAKPEANPMQSEAKPAQTEAASTQQPPVLQASEFTKTETKPAAEITGDFENLADENGFKRVLPKSITKDITDFEITKLSGLSAEKQPQIQERPQWLTQKQATQPKTEEWTELKTESSAYVRPVIVKEIAVGEIVEPTGAEIPESAVSAESVREPVSAQSVVLQVSGSIVENLEKIITQVAGLGAAEESASAQAGRESANVPKMSQAPEVTEFKVTLNPEHLGKVTVKLVTVKQEGAEVKVAVQIIAASDEVRDLLTARAGSVRVMIEHSGVTVERYDVTTEQQQSVSAPSETQQDILDDENGKNQQGNSEKEQGESESDESEISFSELFQAML